MKPWKIGILIALLLLVGYCTINTTLTRQTIVHDEDAAAKIAVQFAQTAFIARDFPQAYNLTSSTFQKHETVESISRLVADMHKNSYPTQIKATEYEPMPGQKAMNIFLKGMNDKEEFYYRFILEGDATSGYKVAGFFRGTGPYPSSRSNAPRLPLQ